MAAFQQFARDYYQEFSAALTAIDLGAIERVIDEFMRIRASGGTLWVAGNGGSAAISDHAVCDTTKGARTPGGATIRMVSLSSNVSLLSAIANDISYDDVFSFQLECYLRANDAVLLISSSGDSENVVRACQVARERVVPSIAFVGFTGGRLSSLADHVVHVPVHNYGMVEDTHQSIMHVLTQYLRDVSA